MVSKTQAALSKRLLTIILVHDEFAIIDCLDAADEGDGSTYKVGHVGVTYEWMGLSVHVLHFFAHFCFRLFWSLLSKIKSLTLKIGNEAKS